MSNKRKPLAQQRTSKRTDTDGYVYNPSGIPVGGTAKFKVGLDPMTGFTEEDIVWDNLGQISFVNNDNHGREVTVRGDSTGEFFLSLAVNGMELTPIPAFFVKVMTPTTAPVTVWIVRDDDGYNAPISFDEISPIIADANKILKQKALTLQWSGSANYTNRTEWLNITDAMNPTNAVLNALLNCSKNTGGVEIYFNKTLSAERLTLGGLNGDMGIVLAKGDENGTGYSGHVLSHEVLHECGLYDIYQNQTNETTLVVTGPISHDRLSQSWGGGYYPPGLMQTELIQRLVMYGVESTMAANQGIDLPCDRVYGLHYTYDYSGRTNIWSLGNALVGQTDIKSNEPVHQ